MKRMMWYLEGISPSTEPEAFDIPGEWKRAVQEQEHNHDEEADDFPEEFLEIPYGKNWELL